MPERSAKRPPGASWPLVFNAGAASVAGFFHPETETAAKDTAIVLCGPVGWEAVASQRACRHLAEALSRVGFPVLRFDYPGTGDSSGGDSDPDRVASWLAGLDGALQELVRLTGRSKIALVGLHLGATLATLAAVAAGGLETLVLWAPYVKGRTFVREAKAYRALNAVDTAFPRAEDRGGLEAAGFLFSASTLADLSQIDLLADPRKAARQVLLLDRVGRPREDKLAAHFEASGTVVTRKTTTDYQELMQEPRKSVIPEATFELITQYFETTHPEPWDGQPRSIRVWRPRMELPSSSGKPVVEEAITFGIGDRLFGVIAEAGLGVDGAPDRPAILFLTTASHHRIGPNRMYVPMARALASRGFTSLRFDLTGVGDSPTVEGVIEGHAYDKSFVKDVQAAMDYLQQVLGFRRFVTVGLCSGAYLGFHACLADARVVGAVLINPQTFNWQEGDSLEINKRVMFMSTRFYRRAALDPDTWRRALRGEINLRGIGQVIFDRLKKRAEVEGKRALRRLGAPQSLDRVDVGDAFQTLLDRDVRVQLIYGGNDEGLDYLDSEVGSRLRRLNKHSNFALEVIDGPDHTFTQLWAQEHLADLVLRHIDQHFR